MQKRLLFEIYEICNDAGQSGVGVRVMNDHDVDVSFTSNVLYSIFYRYLDSVDDGNQLSFTNSVKRRFNKMLKDAPDESLLDEEDIENIEDIEDMEDDSEHE